jgi:Fe-S-cluster-containing dehydrogenase component
VLGLTGLTVATGKAMNASPKAENPIEFNGILYDATRCTGCRGCEYDCADANGLPVPPSTKAIKGLRKPDETCRTVVNEHRTSKGIVPAKIQCMHCNDPACLPPAIPRLSIRPKRGRVWRGDK